MVHKVKKKIVTEFLFKPTPHTPVAVKIPESELKRLNEKYNYGTWYFVNPNRIKYFDDNEQAWKYDEVHIKNMDVIRAGD